MTEKGFVVSDGFFDRLKALADGEGSQNKLAKKTGVNSKTMSAWKKGQKITADSVLKISKGVGCSFEWLSYGQGSFQLNTPIRPSEGIDIDIGTTTTVNKPVNKATASNGSNAIAGNGSIEQHGVTGPEGKEPPKDLEALIALLDQSKDRQKAIFHCMTELMKFIQDEK